MLEVFVDFGLYSVPLILESSDAQAKTKKVLVSRNINIFWWVGRSETFSDNLFLTQMLKKLRFV